jgi:hypothetical protein
VLSIIWVHSVLDRVELRVLPGIPRVSVSQHEIWLEIVVFSRGFAHNHWCSNVRRIIECIFGVVYGCMPLESATGADRSKN